MRAQLEVPWPQAGPDAVLLLQPSSLSRFHLFSSPQTRTVLSSEPHCFIFVRLGFPHPTVPSDSRRQEAWLARVGPVSLGLTSARWSPANPHGAWSSVKREVSTCLHGPLGWGGAVKTGPCYCHPESSISFLGYFIAHSRVQHKDPSDAPLGAVLEPH